MKINEGMETGRLCALLNVCEKQSGRPPGRSERRTLKFSNVVSIQPAQAANLLRILPRQQNQSVSQSIDS
jgi:hypothetical protein